MPLSRIRRPSTTFRMVLKNIGVDIVERVTFGKGRIALTRHFGRIFAYEVCSIGDIAALLKHYSCNDAGSR